VPADAVAVQVVLEFPYVVGLGEHDTPTVLVTGWIVRTVLLLPALLPLSPEYAAPIV